jgi:hypothetical protein
MRPFRKAALQPLGQKVYRSIRPCIAQESSPLDMWAEVEGQDALGRPAKGQVCPPSTVDMMCAGPQKIRDGAMLTPLLKKASIMTVTWIVCHRYGCASSSAR